MSIEFVEKKSFSYGEKDKFIISENISVIEAMKFIDVGNRKTVFITDENGKLLASVTDGDIRRWILQDGDLHENVKKVAHYSPIFIKVGEENKVSNIFSQKSISAIPLVNDDMIMVDVLIQNYDESYNYEPISCPVVVMAGGYGTRLHPYTKILPKPLIPIGEIPISEHIVNRFHDMGCDRFYFIVNYKRNMIKAYYGEDNRDYSVNFVDETIPLGTGGGVGLLKGMISETFILTNCDTLITENFAEIIKEHKKKGNTITMVCSMKNFELPYGVVKIGENGAIKEIKEKPSMPFLTNTGTYIVEPEVIEYIGGEGRKIDFPDVIKSLKDMGKNCGVFPINDQSWFDMGQFDTMDDMIRRLKIN